MKIVQTKWNISNGQEKPEIRNIKGKYKKITFMCKALCTTTQQELLIEFQQLVGPFLCHIFIMRHQYCEIKKKKDALMKKETVIQVDFSEIHLAKAEVYRENPRERYCMPNTSWTTPNWHQNQSCS